MKWSRESFNTKPGEEKESSSQQRRKHRVLGKEDTKRHWQRWWMKMKEFVFTCKGVRPQVCVFPLSYVGSLRVYMYMKSYKHTKQVGLRPLASSPLVFLQTVSRVSALEMWRGCFQVRRSRGASSLRHHLLSHTLRRQLVCCSPSWRARLYTYKQITKTSYGEASLAPDGKKG